MNQEQLLSELIKAIGQRIEQIGEDMQAHGFEGLAVKMEQLQQLREAAFAAEGMRKI